MDPVLMLTYWSFFNNRLYCREKTLPGFKVDLSPIEEEKPPIEDKEVYHFFINIQEKDHSNKNPLRRMVLGTQLLDKLSLWRIGKTNKPLTDVAILSSKGKCLQAIGNIQFFPPSMVLADGFYKVNQAIMDVVADSLLSAWDSQSTNFVMRITIHN